MKWFKHHTDLLARSDAQICLDRFGAIGPYAWIRLLETLAEHLNIDDPGMFIESARDIRTSCFPGCYLKRMIKMLDFFKSMGWLKYKIYGDEIIFNCNIIKELADEYTEKVLADRARKKGK